MRPSKEVPEVCVRARSMSVLRPTATQGLLLTRASFTTVVPTEDARRLRGSRRPAICSVIWKIAAIWSFPMKWLDVREWSVVPSGANRAKSVPRMCRISAPKDPPGSVVAQILCSGRFVPATLSALSVAMQARVKHAAEDGMALRAGRLTI